MRFDVFTLFPQIFDGPMSESIIKRAREAELIELFLHNIRDYAYDKHRITDEPPAGGGGGMVMKAEPIVLGIESLQLAADVPVILMTPQGRVFNQNVARELTQHERLVLLCGRYEGIDERVRQLVVNDEISIGDYVLTGGELAAMVIIDAVSRLIPGVLGARWGAEEDSHATGLLEHPHYTRPAEFRGLKIPDILTSGNHQAVAQWRRLESIRRTWERRPEMLDNAQLTAAEQAFLESLKKT